jgi:hypothetical protein
MNKIMFARPHYSVKKFMLDSQQSEKYRDNISLNASTTYLFRKGSAPAYGGKD